ncbi:transposase [Desulfatibacillum aliphaticivorans]|uniref:transposase n=1 Tax=Desulfatibacillum aliphaticivorans TaxID=218208 RepID=UPI00047F0B7E|nr:transposase [Desulfatibacillum aliphaticivorans]
MPRSSRIDAPGVLHHVMIRGIERKPIFFDDQDRNALEERLSDVLPETGAACYAWVFMENHAHFLLRSPVAGISHVMQRLMTSFAMYINRRYGRHGPLFQNRFKSVICQEDAYFKELVRYIHLNPVRAGLMQKLSELALHPYCGHGNLMGKNRHPWQDVDYVLSGFGKSVREARKNYQAFVEAGISMGRREDLTGGGLIRSMGGWEAVKQAFPSKEHRQKSDQRILGDGDFVQAVLAQAKEHLSRKYVLQSKGLDKGAILLRVASLYGISPDSVLSGTRRKPIPDARAVYCYWTVKELGVAQIQMARDLSMRSSTIAYAVQRGEKIVKENRWDIMDG